MKFIISENKLEKVIFKYLDNKNLVKMVRYGRYIYFAKSYNDEFAKIMYSTDDMWCYINKHLVKELSVVFSISSDEVKKFITNWVMNVLDDSVAYSEILELTWNGPLDLKSW